MSIVHLRIKLKHLSTEPAIIRREERRWLATSRLEECTPEQKLDALKLYESLHLHRLNNRSEIRATALAYGYMRGMPYRVIERAPRHLRPPFDRPAPNWTRVRDLVWQYGRTAPTPAKDIPKEKEALWKALLAWRDVPPPNNS